MNASARGAQFSVLFHQINEKMYAGWCEIDVTVKREDKRVLRYNLNLSDSHVIWMKILNRLEQRCSSPRGSNPSSLDCAPCVLHCTTRYPHYHCSVV